MRIRVFISSPADVSEERAVLRKILSDLPYDPFLRNRVDIEEISWDRPRSEVPLLASLAPQDAINHGLPRPSECDVAVVVLWGRLGTPLGPEYRRPDGRPFRSGTEWEFYDAVTAEALTGRPKVLLYHRDADVVVSLKDPGLASKQEQLHLVDYFLTTAGDFIGSGSVGINKYTDVAKFGELAESHLRAVFKELLDEGKQLGTGRRTDHQLPSTPFPGLRPFSEEESLVFFGREHETSELIQRLGDPKYRFVAVIGASGIGKSSLVNAGVIPALRAGAIPGADSCKVLRMTPAEIEGNPFMALAAKLAAISTEGTLGGPQETALKLARDPASVGQYVADALKGSPPWRKVLLVVDQFEELFGSTTEDRQRAQFVALIAEAVKSEHAVIVVTL